MTFNLSFGSTDKYSPFAELGNYFLSGSPESLKAQEAALNAIGVQLRDWMKDYDTATQHIKAAYPAGAGAIATLETAGQIYTGMGGAARTLSGEDNSLSSVIGRAAVDLADGQDTAKWIKQATDAVVTALEDSTWFSYLAPVAAYAGTVLQFLPAVSNLASMYNNVATLVDNLDPDEDTAPLQTSNAGTVGQGYQAGTSGFMNTAYDPNNPYGAAGTTQAGPWMDSTGQWHYPQPTAAQNGAQAGTTQASPWMDSTGQWHYPQSAAATGQGSPYATSLPTGGGSASTPPGSSGLSQASYTPPQVPGLTPSSSLSDGWVPTDSGSGSSGSGSSGSGSSPSGSSGSGSSGSGSSDLGSSTGSGSAGGGSAPATPVSSGSGDSGAALTGGDSGSGSGSGSGTGTGSGTGSTAAGDTGSGSGASTDTGAPSSHHDSSGVTITISEGDSSMTVTTDRDGHFEGSMNGHDVDIDVDLVDA